MNGVRAVGGRAEGELVERDDIRHVDLAVGDLGLDREEKLAAREFVAGESSAVGAER